MAKTSKKAMASDTTVKGQIASLTIDNARKAELIKKLTEENELFRKQNVELASVIENDLKASLKLNIQARSNYTDLDLETLTLEQLQQIDETLSMGKLGGDATFKNIRAGAASRNQGPMTVGSLYNKTREEILAMGGEH